MIILRSDGTPTYNHSVVVDDHDMGITHVIRGDDHLTNTFRQIQVYRGHGLGPAALRPYPADPRRGRQETVQAPRRAIRPGIQEHGYLPEALCNYLMRLGWSHGDLEVVGREEAIRLFDIVDVNRGASRMDYAKLLNLNGIYIRGADDDRLTQEVMERLAKKPDLSLPPETADRVRALMPALKERAKTLVELANAAVFLARPQQPDPKAQAVLTPDAKTMLRDVGQALAQTEFTVPAVDAALRAFAEAKGLKLGQVAQPLRVALTGSTVSPGIDATLVALGKTESLARIEAASVS